MSKGLQAQWHSPQRRICSLGVLPVEMHPKGGRRQDLPLHLTMVLTVTTRTTTQTMQPLQQQLGLPLPLQNHSALGKRLGAAALEGLLRAAAAIDAAAQLTEHPTQRPETRLKTQRLCQGRRRALRS